MKYKNKIISILILIASVAVIFNGQIRNAIMKHRTEQYVVSNVSKKKIETNTNKKSTYDFSSVKAVDTNSVFKSQLTSDELPVIGGISLPDVKINLPIFKGTTNENLLFGAATMKENQQFGQGNYTLASHHVFSDGDTENMLFSPLKNAKKGMKIYLTDKTNIYTYEINDIFTVTPERVDVIDDVPNQKIITLITCTDAEAQYRTIVRGNLTNVVSYSRAPKEMLNSFSESYNSIKK